jgi:prepilin-type N-terminal cleavage/methylation domain-containing protein
MRYDADVRGYSVIEVLVTMAVLGMLLFAVGTAVTHVLDAEMVGASRQSVVRSVDELAARLAEESRSSTAVFVPASDIFGQPNVGPAGGHEVDIFRKASDGTGTFVAYRFDGSTNAVTRYEYVPGAGGAKIVNSDLMADHIAAVSATRVEPSSISSVVGSSGIKPVNVYYGTAELEGGNGIVTVAIQAGLSGEPQRQLEVHLASRAAPTDVSIVVPSGSPPPSPGPSPTPITVGFLLKSPNPPPHGPNHQGDPGGDPHGPGIVGSAEFYGNGSGNTEAWFELTSQYGMLIDGTYSYRNSNGIENSVTIVCTGGLCPSFVPLPVPTTGPGMLFNTAH